MRRNRMSLKIISYILIQGFICLELSIAGAFAGNVQTNTLAPAMSLNKIDLQGVFSVDSDVVEEDLDWGEAEDLKGEETTEEKMSGSINVSPSTTTMSAQGIGSGQNLINFEPVIPPPPKTVLSNMFSQANLRNILPYPFNKENLEKQLNAYDFELIDTHIDRKLLAYLLEVLEVRDKQFVSVLQNLKIRKIGFKSVITKEGDPRSLQIDNRVLYISPEFLGLRLELRVSILNDAIAGLSDTQELLEYIDLNGETRVTTSKELGIGKSGDDMLRKMISVASNYTLSP